MRVCGDAVRFKLVCDSLVWWICDVFNEFQRSSNSCYLPRMEHDIQLKTNTRKSKMRVTTSNNIRFDQVFCTVCAMAVNSYCSMPTLTQTNLLLLTYLYDVFYFSVIFFYSKKNRFFSSHLPSCIICCFCCCSNHFLFFSYFV